MKFLTKFAQIALNVITGIESFAPIMERLDSAHATQIRTISLDLANIADVITQVEIFGASLALPGADKLKAATPAVAQIILKSAFMAKHEIHDAALFNRGVTKVADGMADILNSLKEDGIKVVEGG